MNTPGRSRNFYYVPAGVPVTTALAQALFSEYESGPEKLAECKILLPTRRSCRALREAFLRRSGGHPLILPVMQPLGDVDEDELGLLGFGGFENRLPPAMSRLERQIILTRLVAQKEGFKGRANQAVALAGELGRLLDQIYIEGLSFDALSSLVPEEYSAHWQITIKFLGIVLEEWPEILKERGVMEEAQRRSELLRMLARSWSENPPRFRIIAAGSTGSIPATAELLSVIADLPRGEVILPGLDKDIDEESWEALDETHPQFMMKRLLEKSGMDRTNVALWPGLGENLAGKNKKRRTLAREIMRPAQTSYLWQDCHFKEKDTDVRRYECRGQQEEALVIAMLLRQALEKGEDYTAALVTPDRELARRVAALCRRWNIEIDDSAGQPLSETGTGILLRLLMRACIERVSPVSLLSLLKHELTGTGLKIEDYRACVRALDKSLRGNKPRPGFEGLRSKKLKDQERRLLDHLETILGPLLELREQNESSFNDWLEAHVRAAEDLCSIENLWSGDDGEAAARFLSELRERAHEFPLLGAEDYLGALEQLMGDIDVRPKYGMHPRLSIFGQLEARHIDADLIILGSLNEGSWPPDTGYDPWMSRPMRREFGLPAAERRTGQSAHDFVECFCSGEIVLTRSRKVDGAPAVPSRWLQRLDTVLEASKIDPEAIRKKDFLTYASLIDKAEAVKSYDRPEPRPPQEKRPRRFSVTDIEKWLADPYYIYAKRVLNLYKLDPLEKPFDVIDRGNILHKTLERFVNDYPGDLDENARESFIDIAREELSEYTHNEEVWELWWPRITRIAGWFISHENQWRQRARPLKNEAKGLHTVELPGGKVELKGKADRIDLFHEGGAAIIDYKSGSADKHKASAIKSGKLPQLPLEAWMLANGAFDGAHTVEVKALCYMVLTGASDPGKFEMHEADSLSELANETGNSFCALVRAFDDGSVPYYAVPRPDHPPQYNDYEHLERLKEWVALGETGEAGNGD